MKKTPLKRKTALKKKSGEQLIRDALWQRIKFARAMFLTAKYGHVICEYCGKTNYGALWGIMDCHHIDRNRRNNTEENAYICHRICHGIIHAQHLKVKQLGFEGKNGNR